MTLLSVRKLRTEILTRDGPRVVVDDLGFSLSPGEVLAIIGESGSGKSIAMQSITGLLPSPPARVTGDTALFEGVDLLLLPERDLRKIRGNRIGMIFQEPMSALNPMMPVGDQIAEAIMTHRGTGWSSARAEAVRLLDRVRITDAANRARQRPAALSGGMRQRVVIAAAIACKPVLVIADEPTTALDATVQIQVLILLRKIQAEMGMGVIFVTHDLGVVAEIADRVAVMYRGRLVETGPVASVFHSPRTRYTRHLIGSSAKFTVTGDQARGGTPPTRERPLLEVEGLDLTFRKRTGLIFRRTREFHALKNVSFTLNEGENLGIVGESGSGKTTLVRALVGLAKADSGRAIYRSKDGREFDLLQRGALRGAGLNREIRMVFQDPFSSLNPRMTVEQVIAEPLVLEKRLTRPQIRDRVAALLERVGLPASVMSRYPYAFSGGQRQRISIARAIAVDPRVIIADEATSALDGSIRSQILDLLFDLQSELGVSYLFVGHDLGVVRYFCDRIAVMHRGELVELGPAASICQTPQKDYTKRLLAAVPATDPDRRRLLTA